MVSDETIKKIDATLKLNSSNQEIIEIIINSTVYEINFTKEDQSSLRDFFKACLDELLKADFEFDFKKAEDYKNDILIKVAENYIKDLNSELKACLIDIRKNQADE